MYNIEIALISLYAFIQTYIEKTDYKIISTIITEKKTTVNQWFFY